MLARDLAQPFPTVGLDSDALDAARTLAEDRLPGLIVLDDDGLPYTVLPGTQVLRFVVPTYVQEDPALARAYDEKSADELCTKLASRPVRDLLPKRKDMLDLPVVAADATAVEVAAVMASMHSPLVAVVDETDAAGRDPSDRPARAPAGAGTRSVTTWLVIAAFTAAYVLIATERIHRVAAALLGAAAMVVLGVVDAHTAFFSEETGVDWNVIFLLLGMMIIVSVIKQTGVFEYLAIWSAKRARGRPFAIMVMLILITAVASALLDNVTTVLLIAPVTLLVCDRLGVPPIPFLLAEVMASNIGGTATLIGDPPNIIIASKSGLTFNDFLVNLAPVVLVLLAVFVLMCRVMFRSALQYDAERVAGVMELDEREMIRDKGLLIKCGVVLALVMAGFIGHDALHLEPSIVAMMGAGALVAISRLESEEFLEDVEWPTLVFFMGLFIMVGALVEVGVMADIGSYLIDSVGDQYFLAGTGLIWGSAALSGIVDNIPYVATMAPIVNDLVNAGGGSDQANALWWALALGADLGGNATAVGASANVVVIGIAARNGHKISFWHFTKYGLVVTFVTIAIAWGYFWLRYFALA